MLKNQVGPVASVDGSTFLSNSIGPTGLEGRGANGTAAIIKKSPFNGPKSVVPDLGAQIPRGTPKIGPGLKQQKGRPWCDHCQKPGQKEYTCWDLH